MPAPSPLDILAEEIGAVAGRIEREAGLRISAALSDFARKDAERELAFDRLMAAIDRKVDERLAALRDGADGKDGAPGRDGADGAAGRDGVNGADGANGKDGERGLQGDRGEKGDDGGPGPPGEPGRDGAPGKDGAPGLDGKQGERGADGAPGKMPIVRAWTSAVHYEGDVVEFGGATYQATRDTGQQPDASDDWLCIAARGADGRGLTVRRTYDPAEAYALNDIVTCNNCSFVAIKDGAGDCPGPDWQLLAGAGKRGEKGLAGERGGRGEPGPAGPTLENWIVDPEEYRALPIMSDGSRGAPIDLRDMFEQFQAETR